MLQRIKLLIVVLVCLLYSGSVLAEKNEILLDYDRQADELTLKEAEVSLGALLRKISALSGVEIKLDPSLEKKITTGFEKKTVEQALLSIAKTNRLNYVMGHMKNDSGNNDLVAFYILKQGEMSAAGLLPLVDPDFEALSQLGKESKYGESHTITRAYRRWENRFATLPPEIRQRLQQKAEETIKKRQEKDSLSAQKRAKSEARRAEKQAQRDRRLEKLKENDPQRYELKMQRRAELEEQAREEAARRRRENNAASGN